MKLTHTLLAGAAALAASIAPAAAQFGPPPMMWPPMAQPTYTYAAPYVAPFVPAPPNPMVLWVQHALNVLATRTVLFEDGVVGVQTTNALAEYQRAHGLPATGFADTATVALLGAQAAPLGVPPPPMAGA